MSRLMTCIYACVLAIAGASAAVAGPVSTDGTVYKFGFTGPGSALGNCGLCVETAPPSLDAGDGPWTFSLTTPGVLTVLDLFLSVDQFEIFNNLVSIGTTSAPVPGGLCGNSIACALGDPDYSRGLFYLLAGDYSITGTQVLGQAGAAVFWIKPIPLPAGILLVLTGAAALGGLAARRKRTH